MTLQAAINDLAAARSAAARKAWVTMRARKAALADAPVTIMPAIICPGIPLPPQAPIVHRSSDADLVTKVYREPELEPVAEFRFVSINLVDHPVVGNGQREFIVLALSRTVAQLFYTPTLETITIHRQVFDRNHLPVSTRRYNRGRIEGRIRARLALIERTNDEAMQEVLKYDHAGTERALALIAN